MICECGVRTGNHDGAVISRCFYHTQAMLLSPAWLARIPPSPTWTRETNDVWSAKMRAQRAKVVELIREYDESRREAR